MLRNLKYGMSIWSVGKTIGTKLNLIAKENKHWIEIIVTVLFYSGIALITYGKISAGMEIMYSEQKEQRVASEKRWEDQGIKNDKFSEAIAEGAANQKQAADLIAELQTNQIKVMKALHLLPARWDNIKVNHQ